MTQSLQADHQGSHQILEIESAAIHTLYAGKKRLRHLGKLTIIENSDSSLWLVINHHTKHEILKGTHFYKI